ncbi:XRE family transcriptional regulator [Streptomyces sp. DH24]|uniref:XRE family transcriptional regulator n=1 Tax=Streptomyces sp. DH24 TaxID=3040123 RepID=UPI0024423892|nr:XRE family transcriptional regulator [Streptomyces sp. DH24]MDG9720925.1 DUF2690 domain-containing protein [Streptomyces sp. DH24]
MPRWKALPEELDPQIREFTSQLRRLVDRSELSIASVADRTGYSKTSWERYLNGRLLAPKGAVVALAEVTGTNPIHLTTMWELAERAWSRSEMRHDMTMEAIRISQARAALGEFGGPAVGGDSGNGKRRSARRGGATAAPGGTGPAGVGPAVPPQPTAADSRDALGDAADARPANSWGVAEGYRHQSGGRAPGGASGGWPSAGGPTAGGPVAGRPGTAPATAATYGVPPRANRPGGAGRGGGGKRRLTTLLAGVVGVLVVTAGAFFLLDGGDKDDEGAGPSPSPSATTEAELPPGVKCGGADCTGKDAENMGCSGEFVTTAQSATVGTTVVEVRYSETCKAAWGRITQAAQGDRVSVTAGRAEQSSSITQAGDAGAYTPMVAVKDAKQAKACVTLAATGEKACTR